jgi:hypothetical protein
VFWPTQLIPVGALSKRDGLWPESLFSLYRPQAGDYRG